MAFLACTGEGYMQNTENLETKDDHRVRSSNMGAWDRFLTLFNPDRDLAAVEYEKVRQTLLTFFRSRGCWDPEQCADETVDRTMRHIDEVRRLIPFMRGVARRVASEVLRTRQNQLGANELNRLVSTRVYSDEKVTRERHLECLDRCLQLLAPADREFILAYHGHEKAEKIEIKKCMAKSFGISREGLRVRAFRLRRELAGRFRAMCPAERVVV
jgi:DNA-directed RNA polymerase specialized sigma24 family protein